MSDINTLLDNNGLVTIRTPLFGSHLPPPVSEKHKKVKLLRSKPTLYVLTTGVRHFQAPQAFRTMAVMGQEQAATVGPTFDEGYGPRKWPEGAKRVVDGHVTVWKKIAVECSGWCFVSEDDAIWPSILSPTLPSDGFVSFFKQAVCAQATKAYSENYDSVVKAVVPAQCMPYGAVAYAITGDFAKMLLSNLPMSKPVDHFLWEQAVVQRKAYVSRRYIVQHKKGKSLRQTVPPAAQLPAPLQLTCSNFESSVKTRWTKNTCTQHSFDMAVHSIPDIVSDRIISSGCWEKDIITQIVQHLGNQRSGHTKLFLDIGANIWAFTSTIASLGHEVIAVEPFKLNVPLIQATMCRHNLNIHLYKVGLADTSPGQKMCIWSTNEQINNGNARMTPYFEGIKDFGTDKQKKCMEVIHTYTLDELLFETYKLRYRRV
jgi:FkbM family methyltransferase